MFNFFGNKSERPHTRKSESNPDTNTAEKKAKAEAWLRAQRIIEQNKKRNPKVAEFTELKTPTYQTQLASAQQIELPIVTTPNFNLVETPKLAYPLALRNEQLVALKQTKTEVPAIVTNIDQTNKVEGEDELMEQDYSGDIVNIQITDVT